WGRMAEVVRSGRSVVEAALGEPLWDYYGRNPQEGAAFSAAMNDMSGLVANALAGSGLIPRGATIVDVGGAHGLMLAAALEADPSARGILYDLPSVVPTAETEIARRGLAARCAVVGGD